MYFVKRKVILNSPIIFFSLERLLFKFRWLYLRNKKMNDEYIEYFANEESENDSDSDDEPWEFEEDVLPKEDTDDTTFVNLPPAAKVPKIETRNWIGGAFDPQLFPFDEKDSGIYRHIEKEDELPLYWFECTTDGYYCWRNQQIPRFHPSSKQFR